MANRSGKTKRSGTGRPTHSPPKTAGSLHEVWQRLHVTDREPWPDEPLIGRLAGRYPTFAAWLESSDGAAALARDLQNAWERFHAGQFKAAIEAGSRLGALGATVANKAAAVHSLYSRRGSASALALLDAAVKRGEQAIAVLPGYANAHYTLALALGRYSQGISILKALAAGVASRVRTHLERALELEPQHAEAHVAFGLYHAEIVNKLGSLAAGITYGATADAALLHLRLAVKLAPASPIVHIEYANGLLLLDGERYRQEARALYLQAATFEPADEMERLDVERARRGLD